MIVTVGGTARLAIAGFQGNQRACKGGFSSAEPVILRYPEMSPGGTRRWTGLGSTDSVFDLRNVQEAPAWRGHYFGAGV